MSSKKAKSGTKRKAGDETPKKAKKSKDAEEEETKEVSSELEGLYKELNKILADVPSFKEFPSNLELMDDKQWHYDEDEHLLLYGDDLSNPEEVYDDDGCYKLYIGKVFSIVTARRRKTCQTVPATYILVNRLRQTKRPKTE